MWRHGRKMVMEKRKNGGRAGSQVATTQGHLESPEAGRGKQAGFTGSFRGSRASQFAQPPAVWDGKNQLYQLANATWQAAQTLAPENKKHLLIHTILSPGVLAAPGQVLLTSAEYSCSCGQLRWVGEGLAECWTMMASSTYLGLVGGLDLISVFIQQVEWLLQWLGKNLRVTEAGKNL